MIATPKTIAETLAVRHTWPKLLPPPPPLQVKPQSRLTVSPTCVFPTV